jgi:hypothetical protein
MCRNIKTLSNLEPHVTTDEVRAAALQYVRKISGTRDPSKANVDSFEQAVEEIAAISQHLLDHWVTNAEPRNREEEAAKARARYQARVAS